MQSHYKIYYLLALCTITLSGKQYVSITPFDNALDEYNKNPTQENASKVVAEFDKPEVRGPYRPLLKQQLTRANLTINRLRIQAKTGTPARTPEAHVTEPTEVTVEKTETPQAIAVAPATHSSRRAKKPEINEFTAEEVEIKKLKEQIKHLSAQQSGLAQKLSGKMDELTHIEGLLADTAGAIYMNSVQGQKNNFTPLLEETQRAIALQDEIQGLEQILTEKQEALQDMSSSLRQKKADLARKRKQLFAQRTKAHFENVKGLVKSYKQCANEVDEI